MWSNTAQSYCTRTVDGRKRRRRAGDVKIFGNRGMTLVGYNNITIIKRAAGTHVRILRTAFYADKHFRKTEPSRHYIILYSII